METDSYHWATLKKFDMKCVVNSKDLKKTGEYAFCTWLTLYTKTFREYLKKQDGLELGLGFMGRVLPDEIQLGDPIETFSVTTEQRPIYGSKEEAESMWQDSVPMIYGHRLTVRINGRIIFDEWDR